MLPLVRMLHRSFPSIGDRMTIGAIDCGRRRHLDISEVMAADAAFELLQSQVPAGVKGQ